MLGYLSVTISDIIKPSVLNLCYLGMRRSCVDKEQTFALKQPQFINTLFFITHELKNYDITLQNFSFNLVCDICKNCNNHKNRQST